MGNNLNINSNNNEITNLKNELSKANKIIEQQKLIINNLKTKINNYENTVNNLYDSIINYQNIINQNNLQLNHLKLKSSYNDDDTTRNKVFYDEIMVVNFISSDSRVHYVVKCNKTSIFAEIEEKLYQQFPEYRETNNIFLANGTRILRFKTVEQNKIGDGLPVTLIIPS